MFIKDIATGWNYRDQCDLYISNVYKTSLVDYEMAPTTINKERVSDFFSRPEMSLFLKILKGIIETSNLLPYLKYILYTTTIKIHHLSRKFRQFERNIQIGVERW